MLFQVSSLELKVSMTSDAWIDGYEYPQRSPSKVGTGTPFLLVWSLMEMRDNQHNAEDEYGKKTP